jgi:hypothetical protein
MSSSPITDRSAAAKPKTKAPQATPVATYKSVLRRVIDSRPSGLRARIASEIGKHKSFVSQLTNPIYPMPVPAQHLKTIFDVCRFSPDDRREFVKAYLDAHPDRADEVPDEDGSRGSRKTLTLQIPDLGDPRKQRALESLIQDIIERLVAIVR